MQVTLGIFYLKHFHQSRIDSAPLSPFYAENNIQEELRIETKYVTLCTIGFCLSLLAIGTVQGATSPTENLSLYSGNVLIVSSTQMAIKSVVVRGNLTAATIPSENYPAKNFTLTTNSTNSYNINILLSYPTQYTTSITIQDESQKTNTQYTSYYVSNGDLNLTIYATFQTPPPSGGIGPVSWNSFYNWFSQFGNAFPTWVKILYGVLAIQFGFVGYRWIKFEEDKRRIEGHLPPLDRGNRAYLWTDVLFRTLVAGFAISLAIMIGEVVVVGLAEYLFLVNLNLSSLLDFFSLFFVAALATLVYLMREGLDRLFDLKPMMED